MPKLYADDPDVAVTFPLTATSGTLDFDPVVRVEGLPDIPAQWLGEPGPTRRIRVPLAGLPAWKVHELRLVLPGDVDVRLGEVTLY